MITPQFVYLFTYWRQFVLPWFVTIINEVIITVLKFLPKISVICIMQVFIYWFFLFSSVAQSCPTLCDPMDHSMPGLPVHHQLPEFTQTHVSWVSDDIQSPHPLSSPSPPTFNLSQHQGLFKWISSSHLAPKVVEFQLQHQSFQWIFRTDFL